MKSLYFALLTCWAVAAVAEPAAPGSSGVESRAVAVMHDFLAAFNARDEAAWAQTLHFPHVRVASGSVVVYDSAEDFLAAMDLDAFAETSGWHHSTWDEMRVIQHSDDKVHITVTFSRFDAAGELMSTYESLYIVQIVDGRWGVRARSSFAP